MIYDTPIKAENLLVIAITLGRVIIIQTNFRLSINFDTKDTIMDRFCSQSGIFELSRGNVIVFQFLNQIDLSDTLILIILAERIER